MFCEGLSGRCSDWFMRLLQSPTVRNCRTYYRFALFSLSIITFLNALVLILSIFKFAIYDFIYFTFMTAFCGAICACIHYLIKFSDMPESNHWLTHAQTHISGSSILAFIMFSYSSSLRAPFSAPLRVCLSSNVKDVLGNVRCQIVLVMDGISWLAPVSMLIAAWLVYFSATRFHYSEPRPLVWRHINVADAFEPLGELVLP